MRPIDEPIPPDERLFRSIARKDVDGDHLDPTSIDLPATSVGREKYCAKPEDALRHGDTGIAVTTAASLPVPTHGPTGVEHSLRAIDDPIEGDDAHAEIRHHRDGRYDAKHKAGKMLKLELRKDLAHSFRVLIPPTA